MSDTTYAQLVGLCAGLLLLCSVLIVWRRAVPAQIRLLAVQGVVLGCLATVLSAQDGEPQLLAVAALVLALKGIALPRILSRAALTGGGMLREETPWMNTAASLVSVALLTVLAYLVSRPMLALGTTPAVTAVPVGISMVLLGFLVLATRRHAVSQLIGFLLLDNGIATVSFLTAGGVPLVVELGAFLDVLLVVLVLQVLAGRIRLEFGESDLDDLRELRD